MTTNRKTCAGCKAWKRNAEGDTDLGRCRIESPCLPAFADQAVDGDMHRAVWPVTRWDEWCDEHDDAGNAEPF